jgi:hypothetical protein
MPQNLGEFRKLDQALNVEGQVIQEKQTLNSKDVHQFLTGKGFLELLGGKETQESLLENFKKRFDLNMAIEYLQRSGKGEMIEGEARMLEILTSSRAFLKEHGLPEDLLNSPDQEKTALKINLELKKISLLEKEQELLKAYETYLTIHQLFSNYIQIQMASAKSRKEKQVEVGEGLKETFSGWYKHAKKGFGKMSGWEKAGVVGLALVGVIGLFGSENPRVKRWKEGIFTLVKLGLGAFAVNAAGRFVTEDHKTLWQALNEESEPNVMQEDFFTKTFQAENTPENAEKLRDSVMYLGDKDFMYLAEEYRLAKAQDRTEIEMPGIATKEMTPRDIYIALDLFFSKFPLESSSTGPGLLDKYHWATPPMTWKQVVGTELAESNLVFTPGLLDRAENFATRNAVRVNKAAHDFYYWITGHKGTSEQVHALEDEAGIILASDQLPEFVRKNMADHADGFLKTLDEKASKEDPEYQLTFVEDEHSYYIKAHSAVPDDQLRGKPELLGKAREEAKKNIGGFLKTKFPNDDVDQSIIFAPAAFDADAKEALVFASVPKHPAPEQDSETA